MAYTKIKPIKTRLDTCVNYVLNKDKTDLSNALDYVLNDNKTTNENVIYESAINCYKETAFQDMTLTKKAYKKTGGIQGYHIMQSFKPNEITPKQAHEIGNQFAKECFGDKYEVVIATHLDKNHLHNHVVINSVSFVDGKKYTNLFKDYYKDIRGTSDKICKEYGLSIITPHEDNKTISYAEWLARNKGKTSWQSIIRMDLDDAIKAAFNYGNFIMLMQNKGYEIKQGKYLAVRPYGKERFSRTCKLGDGYDVETIKAKILGKDLQKELPQYKRQFYNKKTYYHKGKVTGFRALCLHYMYLLGVVKRNETPEKVSFLLKEDLIKFENMTKIFDFLKDRNLQTYEDIINYKTKCNETIELLKVDKHNHKEELKDKNPLYKALIDLGKYKEAHILYLDGYTGMEEEHEMYLQAKKTFEKAGYSTPSQIENLRKEYSLHLEESSKHDGDIRYFRYEIKMCGKAIINDEHIRKQMKKVEQLKEQQERREGMNLHRQ